MLLYQEKVSFKLFTPLMIIFIGITIFFFYIVYLHLMGVDVSETHGPIGASIFMAIFFLFTTLIVAQFKELAITINDEQLVVNFGFFKRVIKMNIIETPYIDKANALLSYGGWGIRLSRFKRKRRLVFNLPNTSRVVVPLKGKPQEFVFSTERPEEVLEALKSLATAPKDAE